MEHIMTAKKSDKKNNKQKKTSKEKLSNKKNDKNLLLIDNLTTQLESLKDKNIKLLAEFDNYQRRTLVEKDKTKKYEGFNFIKDLLPVFDDIDRAESIEEEGNIESLSEAAKMIKSKLSISAKSNDYNFFLIFS